MRLYRLHRLRPSRALLARLALLALLPVVTLGCATAARPSRTASAPPPDGAPSSPGVATSIAARTGGMARRDGFIPLYID